MIEKGYLQFLFNINRNWNEFIGLVLSTTANRTNKTRKGLLEPNYSNSPFPMHYCQKVTFST
jgi:hypothetical protein